MTANKLALSANFFDNKAGRQRYQEILYKMQEKGVFEDQYLSAA